MVSGLRRRTPIVPTVLVHDNEDVVDDPARSGAPCLHDLPCCLVPVARDGRLQLDTTRRGK